MSEMNYCILNSNVQTFEELHRLSSQFPPSAHENGCFVSTPIVKIKQSAGTFRTLSLSSISLSGVLRRAACI